MLRGSISTSSLYTYQRPWLLFKQFLSEQLGRSNLSLPVSVHDLALFIAYLAKSKYSASTVFTYISSIGYVHRLGSFPDPTQSPTVKLALKGYSKLNPSVADSRLPITLPLLERIVIAFSSTVSGDYHRKLMKAMCAIAFFAALRVGEITFRSGQSSKNVIQLNQISFLASTNGETSAIKLTMRFFKHSNPTQPVDILLHKSQPICPVTTIAEYLSVRGNLSGPYFVGLTTPQSADHNLSISLIRLSRFAVLKLIGTKLTASG